MGPVGCQGPRVAPVARQPGRRSRERSMLALPRTSRRSATPVGEQPGPPESFISPDLLAIGDEGFVADDVSLGTARYERGGMTIADTRIGTRAFIGNSALLPP